jgi:hypothetical protein
MSEQKSVIENPITKAWLAWAIAFAASVLSSFLTGQRFPAPATPVAPGMPGLPPIIAPQPSPVVPQPPAPPPEAPKPPVGPKVDPENGIYRIHMGNSGCSASLIDWSAQHNAYLLLTAAHCISKGTGSLIDRDGNHHTFTVVYRCKDCDYTLAILKTKTMLNVCRLAKSDPKPGTAIWHKGFGVDRPGNVETGMVVAVPEKDDQLRMNLSASSGDSGGPILRSDTNEVISVVCCGTGMKLWGARTDRIREGVSKVWNLSY